MGLGNFFKENKKKALILGISIVLLIVVSFFTIAYVSGKHVTDKVNLQWVSHTEYWRGDSASTIIRLADYKGAAYNADSCKVTILYPDKTVFVNNQPLSESTIPGNWYRTDSLENKPLGTYEQEVTCVKGGTTILSSQSFHLNPALEEIAVITNKSSTLINSLANVHINLTALIQDTNQSVSTQVTTSESNLNNALTEAKTQIISNLNNSGVSTQATLTSINATITTQLSNVNTQINSHLDNLGLSLNNSLDALNADITSQLTTVLNKLSLLNQSLFDFNVKISGALADTNRSISTQIGVTESNLNNALNAVNQGILDNLTATGININSNLANAQATIVTRIDNLDATVTTNLNTMNSTLRSFLSGMQSTLSTQLDTMLADLTTQLTSIKSDTSWIASNTMNQQNAAEINQRFNDVDANMAKVLAFCSESVTNSSALCVEVYALRAAVANLRTEQQQQFLQLNETTTNTWQLLSGSISDRIDSILINLHIIQEQNREINATTQQILANQQAEIRANIIS